MLSQFCDSVHQHTLSLQCLIAVIVVVVMVVAVLWFVLCLSGIHQVVRVPVHTRQEWLYSVWHRAICKCYHIKILLW
jgi:hypothetical protein